MPVGNVRKSEGPNDVVKRQTIPNVSIGSDVYIVIEVYKRMGRDLSIYRKCRKDKKQIGPNLIANSK